MKAIYSLLPLFILFHSPHHLSAANKIDVSSAQTGQFSITISNTENIQCFQFTVRSSGGTIKNLVKTDRLLQNGWTTATNIKNDTVAYVVVYNLFGDSLVPGSGGCIMFNCIPKGNSPTIIISIDSVKGTDSRGNYVELTTNHSNYEFQKKIGQIFSSQNTSNVQSIGNFPNPFNPTTTITFSLLENAFVAVNIYDVCGRLIMVLNYGELYEGTHSFQWNGKSADGRAVSSGIYFAQIKTHFETVIHKMLLTK